MTLHDANSATVLYKCRTCGQDLPSTAYYNRKRDHECKACACSRAKQRYHSCAKTRTGIKYRNRVSLIKSYGLTVVDFENMLIAQNSMCAGCNIPLDLFAPDKQGNSACIDHDHATGLVRGLLCRCCNLAIGYAQDSPTNLRSLALYSEKHNG